MLTCSSQLNAVFTCSQFVPRITNILAINPSLINFSHLHLSKTLKHNKNYNSKKNIPLIINMAINRINIFKREISYRTELKYFLQVVVHSGVQRFFDAWGQPLLLVIYTKISIYT